MENKGRIVATVINDLHHDQRMIRICDSLQRRHYDVLLLGRKQFENPPPSRSFRQERITVWPQSGPLFYLVYQLLLFLRLMRTPFDVVHAVDLDTVLPGLVAARLKGKKVIFDAHEYFTEVPELLHSDLKRRIWKFVERFAVPRVNACITVGPALAEIFTKEYGRPFEVIMNTGRKGEAMDAAEPATERFILYQGALNQGRGVELLLEAVKDIDIRVCIAGDGLLRAQLESLTRSYGLQDRVEFLGFVPPEELPLLSRKAWLGFNVSEPLGTSYYFSLNNKYFDYIHAGIPALTNDFPEYRRLEASYSCGMLTEATATAIAENIKLLLNDSELYGNLKKNCVLASRVWTWEREEEKLITLYNGLSD